ncbi:MAG: FRG domain-containing protein [Nitrospirae bacterium]|nr:FRG domain-containing protein [Nitrospirota bacterium]
MPVKLVEKEIDNLEEFMKFIEGNMTGSKPLWYRGCGDTSYKLTPTLYRHPEYKEFETCYKIERDILNYFKERSVPFQTRILKNDEDWEHLFLMQHFAVPSRLLDWTENPFIALYFALTSHKKDKTANAAVWVLAPILWNKKALNPNVGILSISQPMLNSYMPNADPSSISAAPIALYGIFNSTRIVAQRGVFTIFGTNLEPMEEIYEQDKYPDDCLRKIIIPNDRIEKLLNSVISIGITDSVVFPDLDGLSKEIRRFHGYEV